jgi:hypothetical protein
MKHHKNTSAQGITPTQTLDLQTPLRIKHSKPLKIMVAIGITLCSFNIFYAQSKTPEPEQLHISQTATPKQMVSGTITDTDKTPLAGANILLQGTEIGAAADFDGHFKFPKALQKGDTLIISYIGYQTQTIPINNQQSPLNIVLDVDNVLITCDVPTNPHTSSPKQTLWQKVKTVF